MSDVHAALLALLTVAVVCVRPPTAVIGTPPVHMDFLNGPEDLPNVFRTATNAGFSMRDPRRRVARPHLPGSLVQTRRAERASEPGWRPVVEAQRRHQPESV